jgi:hypothetical protein
MGTSGRAWLAPVALSSDTMDEVSVIDHRRAPQLRVLAQMMQVSLGAVSQHEGSTLARIQPCPGVDPIQYALAGLTVLLLLMQAGLVKRYRELSFNLGRSGGHGAFSQRTNLATPNCAWASGFFWFWDTSRANTVE